MISNTVAAKAPNRLMNEYLRRAPSRARCDDGGYWRIRRKKSDATRRRSMERRSNRSVRCFGTLFILLASCSACEATADLGYSDKTFEAGGQDAGSNRFPFVPEPALISPDASLARLKARCADPAHGPAARYDSFTSFQKKVVGRWFSCSPRPPLVGDALGIAFHADGTWNLLRYDGMGAFVAQRGLDHEGRWGEKYASFVEYFQIDVAGASHSLFAFAFETNPRRMRMRRAESSSDAEGEGWFVTMEVDDINVRNKLAP